MTWVWVSQTAAVLLRQRAPSLQMHTSDFSSLDSFLGWDADKGTRCSPESHRDAWLLDAIRTISVHLT